MFNRLFSTAFAILGFVLITTQSNAQCGDIQIHKSVDCQTGATTVTVTPHGPNGPYHIAWEDGDSNWTKTFDTPGTYHVTIWGDSCFFLATCVTTSPVCCLYAYWDSTPDDCKSAPTGSATIFSVENGTGPYSYEWHSVNDDLSINPVIIGTGISIHNVHGGNYVVYIHDLGSNNSDCNLEQWVYVEQESSPTVTLHANALTCNETTTTINTQVSNGPVSFLWNTGATTNSLMNVGPGTYTVKVTNPSGCSDSDTIEITAPQQVTLHATAMPTTCGENNGSVTFTSGPWPIVVEAPSGAIYNLSGPLATISDLQSGVYTATVTNGAGCTMVESAVVGDSDPAKDSMICITICEPSLVNGTWVSTSTTLTETLINSNGCPFVFTTKVNLQSTDTTHQTAYTCFGGVITVNGVSYQKDTVVYVQMNGNCPGLTVWNLQFSDEPGSVSLPPVKICGGDSLATYTFTNTIGTGCPELIVTRTFEQHPYTMQFALTSADTICGLAVRSDSLFRKIHVDNVNCIITQPFGLLVTNLPTTTITPGPTHYFCGTPADSTWVETSDVTDIANCSRNITGYWSVTTPQPLLYRDTIQTCFDSVAALYPRFAPGINCNPDTLTIAIKAQKPNMEIVYRDTTCDYTGPLPIAPVQILHPGNNCVPDTMIILSQPEPEEISVEATTCKDSLYLWPLTGLYYPTGFSYFNDPANCRHYTLYVTEKVPVEKVTNIQTCLFGLPDSVITTCDTIFRFHFVTVSEEISVEATTCKDSLYLWPLTGLYYPTGFSYFNDPANCRHYTLYVTEKVPVEKVTNIQTCEFGLQDSVVTTCDTLYRYHFVTLPSPHPVPNVCPMRCGDNLAKVTIGGLASDDLLFWDFGNDNDTLMLAPGTYHFAVDGANGCSVSDSVIIGPAPTIPALELAVDSITCDSAGSVRIVSNLTPGTLIEWSYNLGDSVVMESPTTAVANQSGFYGVTVTTPEGCVAEQSVFVPTPDCRPKVECEVTWIHEPGSSTVTVIVKPKSGGEVQSVQWLLWAQAQANRYDLGTGTATIQAGDFISPGTFILELPFIPTEYTQFVLSLPSIVVDGEEFVLVTAHGNAFCIPR